MAMDQFLVLLVCLALQPGAAGAFNLDTSIPLVKEGARGSLFGFSVSLHEQTAGKKRFLLLVGAPKEKAELHVPANQTGGVYSCPITSELSDCSRMDLIGSDSDLDENQDLVEDMWLGVSVASQKQPGGRVLACGHRFVKFYGSFRLRQMIGRCYIRGNNLQYDPDDLHWQNPNQFCRANDDQSAPEDEVMCNVGISAAITQTEIIVGSPGSYEWQGNVHVSWMNPDVLYDTQQSSFPNLDRRHIYIGYSVAQADRLLSRDVVTIVTGAPKDSKEDGRGSVMLAERRRGARKEALHLLLTLRGEQMGSYYGNAVAVTDLNNDGWNDLLVGAPFFFHHQREEGGSVYVYINRGGHLWPQSTTTLRGPLDSGFGMALVAIGDVNQDGFQDFAVGAPFHGTGSVMIWTGNAEGISPKPSQVIKGEDVTSAGFRTFGYSLAGGLDVDQNHYPDLLVGSLDDRVALLRARPVIQLKKTLIVSPEVINPNSCEDCVQVEVCFSLKLNPRDQSPRNSIKVRFTVEVDVTRHNSRLRFLSNGKDVYHGFLSVPTRPCATLMLGVVIPLRDKVEPLVFSLNGSLAEEQNKNLQPVLNPTQSEPSRTQIHILKECGSDNRCHSNLQMTAQFANQELVPLPRHHGIQVFQYNANVKKLYLVVNVTNLPLPLQQAEDAHSAALRVSIPLSLKYSGVRTKSLKLSEQSDLSPVSLSLLVEYSLQTTFSLIKQPGHVQFSGHVTGESAMTATGDVGSLLLFTFQVDIIGKPLGHLGNLEVEFEWPLETSNGKWLLYLTEIRLAGASEPRCVPPGNVANPLNLTDCMHMTARCVKFICPLVNMNNSATLSVRARLWNSTMIEDYSEVQSVSVAGQVSLKLLTNNPTIRMETHTIQCAFFRHANTWELYEAKSQRAHMKSQPP
ncbi:integrin alpha-3-like [Lampris incognitus]|uniref:integrin alpha-3-like n=1 Tax=Lampris incognitus TaxID=2546036 RepID=UPI0024B4E8E2|nr:integrin alpha-3-like [Lampris incognitus]